MKEGLYIPVNGVTPDEMDRMAAKLEEAARALRTAAVTLRGGVSVPSPNGPVTVPAYMVNPPTVLEAVEKVLRHMDRPIHISELYDLIRHAGAYVSTRDNLSSMLSKDAQRTVRPSPGRRGFWELVPEKPNFSSNINQPGA